MFPLDSKKIFTLMPNHSRGKNVPHYRSHTSKHTDKKQKMVTNKQNTFVLVCNTHLYQTYWMWYTRKRGNFTFCLSVCLITLPIINANTIEICFLYACFVVPAQEGGAPCHVVFAAFTSNYYQFVWYHGLRINKKNWFKLCKSVDCNHFNFAHFCILTDSRLRRWYASIQFVIEL